MANVAASVGTFYAFDRLGGALIIRLLFIIATVGMAATAWAAGAAFEAETPAATLNGSMITAMDAGACGGERLEVAQTPNDAAFPLAVGSAADVGDYYLWLHVWMPTSSTRALLVALDAGGTFNGPADRFDMSRGSTSGYTWERVTRRGNGTAGAPQFDPWLLPLPLSPTNLILGISILDNDVYLDRIAVSNRPGFVPNGCDAYADPTPQDGGGSPQDGSTPQDGGGSGQDGGGTGPPGGDSGPLRGWWEAGCQPGEYFDLAAQECRKPQETGCRAVGPFSWSGLVFLVLLRRKGREQKSQ